MIKYLILGIIGFSFLATVIGCATTRAQRAGDDIAADDYYKNHGVIWRIFHPRVIAGRPWWQKALYWIGPGHCPFCRTVLNKTTNFDNWPSPYYDFSNQPGTKQGPPPKGE